jgi:hypothetical protein
VESCSDIVEGVEEGGFAALGVLGVVGGNWQGGRWIRWAMDGRQVLQVGAVEDEVESGCALTTSRGQGPA